MNPWVGERLGILPSLPSQSSYLGSGGGSYMSTWQSHTTVDGAPQTAPLWTGTEENLSSLSHCGISLLQQLNLNISHRGHG